MYIYSRASAKGESQKGVALYKTVLKNFVDTNAQGSGTSEFKGKPDIAPCVGKIVLPRQLNSAKSLLCETVIYISH